MTNGNIFHLALIPADNSGILWIPAVPISMQLFSRYYKASCHAPVLCPVEAQRLHHVLWCVVAPGCTVPGEEWWRVIEGGREGKSALRAFQEHQSASWEDAAGSSHSSGSCMDMGGTALKPAPTPHSSIIIQHDIIQSDVVSKFTQTCVLCSVLWRGIALSTLQCNNTSTQSSCVHMQGHDVQHLTRTNTCTNYTHMQK